MKLLGPMPTRFGGPQNPHVKIHSFKPIHPLCLCLLYLSLNTIFSRFCQFVCWSISIQPIDSNPKLNIFLIFHSMNWCNDSRLSFGNFEGSHWSLCVAAFIYKPTPFWRAFFSPAGSVGWLGLSQHLLRNFLGLSKLYTLLAPYPPTKCSINLQFFIFYFFTFFCHICVKVSKHSNVKVNSLSSGLPLSIFISSNIPPLPLLFFFPLLLSLSPSRPGSNFDSNSM